MSWFERATFFQALRPIAVWLWYLAELRSLAAQGRLAGEAGLVELGWLMLLFILVTIGVGIVIQILFVILTTVSGQETMADLEDERSKLIEAQATVTGFGVAGFGFLAAVLALWQGWGAVWAFNLMLGGMVAADVVVNLRKFFRFWRGG
jgi:hypothetical protein